jgi:hypothetical protein
MAPRRLVLAMLLLLAFSTVIALMAPDPSERSQQETERQAEAGSNGTNSDSGSRFGSAVKPNTTAAGDGKTDSGSEEDDRNGSTGSISRTVNAGGPTEVIRVRSGQRLVLEVRSSKTIEVSIPELGRFATADRWAPAVFDLIIPARPKALEVVGLASGKSIARLVAG